MQAVVDVVVVIGGLVSPSDLEGGVAPLQGLQADFLAETYPDLTAVRTYRYSHDWDGLDTEGAK